MEVSEKDVSMANMQRFGIEKESPHEILISQYKK
jgi:hypothetical protein